MKPTAAGQGSITALPERRREWIVLAVIIALAAFVRAYQIGAVSLRHDEAYSFWASQLSWRDIWHFVTIGDRNPPLFHALLKLWSFFMGDSEASLRSLSAVFGVLTVPCAYGLGRLSARPRDAAWVGSMAALIVALQPQLLVFAQDARAYAGLAFSVALMTCGAAWLLRHPDDAARPLLGSRRRPPSALGHGSHAPARAAWIATTAGAALTLWLHNTGTFIVVSVGLVALTWLGVARRWQRSTALNALIAATVVALLWAPALPFVLHQATAITADFWIPAPTLGLLGWVLRDTLALETFRWDPALPIILAVGAAGLWRIVRGAGWPAALLVGGVPAIAIALEIVVSWTLAPIIIPRTMVWTVIPVAAMLAATSTLVDRLPWRLASSAALGLSFLFACYNYHEIRATQTWHEVVDITISEPTPSELDDGPPRVFMQREPWRDFVRIILADAGPNDLVIVTPGIGDVSFRYYFGFERTAPRVVDFPFGSSILERLTTGKTKGGAGRWVPGGHTPTDKDYEAIRREMANAEAVWLLEWDQSSAVGKRVAPRIAELRRADRQWQATILTLTRFQ